MAKLAFIEYAWLLLPPLAPQGPMGKMWRISDSVSWEEVNQGAKDCLTFACRGNRCKVNKKMHQEREEGEKARVLRLKGEVGDY